MENLYCRQCNKQTEINLEVEMDDNPEVKLIGWENGRPKFSVKHTDTTVRAECTSCYSTLAFSTNLPDCEVLGEV